MKKSLLAGLAIAAVASMSFTAPALASPPAIDVFIADTSQGLSSVDVASGVATPIGNIGIYAVGGGLNPVDSKIYLVTQTCDVYTVDVVTPSATQVGTISSLTHGPNPVTTCDSATIDGSGVLWASAEASGDDLLVTYDTATNTPTLMPGTQPDYYDALWFDPSDGTLRGQYDTGGNVATFDLTSGVATDTGVVMSPYSYGVVLDNAGNYYSSDWDTFYAGVTSDYSTSTFVGDFGGAASAAGVQAVFTTTNFWPGASAGDQLPSTGASFGALWLGLGLLIAAGGVFAIRRKVRSAR